MEFPSCLNDTSEPLVADTSAIINLIATGRARQIIQILPNRVLVAESIPAELQAGQSRDRRTLEDLKDLTRADLIEIVSLDDADMQTFEELVIGPAATTLDDGEAATISYAMGHARIAAVDERKANSICGQRFPALRMASTIDLLSHREIVAALEPEGVADAVFKALRDARMSVLPHHLGWVVQLVGTDRAAECRSLPRAARLPYVTNRDKS
jgi:predicted nucleic acid-binding protein